MYRKNRRYFFISLVAFAAIVYTGIFTMRESMESQLISSGIAYENLFAHVIIRSVIAGILVAALVYFSLKFINYLLTRLNSGD